MKATEAGDEAVAAVVAAATAAVTIVAVVHLLGGDKISLGSIAMGLKSLQPSISIEPTIRVN